jgi:hypothetical protein
VTEWCRELDAPRGERLGSGAVLEPAHGACQTSREHSKRRLRPRW